MTAKQMLSDPQCTGKIKPVGQVSEIWRYPVSSIGGQQCQNVDITETGIVGDRQFGLFDPSTGKTASPENDSRWHPALFLRAIINSAGETYIHFPNGEAYQICHPAIGPELSRYFGFSVAVGRYNNGQWPAAEQLPMITHRYQPSPLHLITSSSRERLSDLLSSKELDVRRFRPNIVLNTGAEPGFLENEWLGHTIHGVGLSMRATEHTKRCGMTMIAQPDIEADVEVLRAIVRNNRRSFGIYCDVVTAGGLDVGTELVLKTSAVRA
ncbi:MOSC domain-containing protein [Allorhizobium terrae]|uniref:MOSC domain-containing protein n=1 Tax=Allorhizobium terrae TaxID=1848972 RepID=A0A4S3ZNY8_9HYPH|nr:MOSC domain-containing protein [Allorhizobium terrae]THF47195.1 MOSC domain-containing protein [Allorhizobium terrae]